MGELRAERQQDRDALSREHEIAQRLPVPLHRDGRKRPEVVLEHCHADSEIINEEYSGSVSNADTSLFLDLHFPK